MLASMRDSSDLRYIKLHDDLFWAATCRGFAFGSLSNDYRIPDLKTEFISKGDMKTVFDSALNGIQMPPTIFDEYVEALQVHAGTDDAFPYVDGSGFFVGCNTYFPNLYFMLDNTWIEVEPKHYVRDVSELQDGSNCVMQL